MLLIKPERSDYNRVYGQIAGRYGYLNEDQLDICIDDLSVLEERGRDSWLGEVGMMRGLLTEDERNRISIASRYYFAREEDKLIARVGVRYGFIDEGSSFLNIRRSNTAKGSLVCRACLVRLSPEIFWRKKIC